MNENPRRNPIKAVIWTLAGLFSGAIGGGIAGAVLAYSIAAIASAGRSNEMLGVAGVEGAMFRSPIGVLLLGGLGLWIGLRR